MSLELTTKDKYVQAFESFISDPKAELVAVAQRHGLHVPTFVSHAIKEGWIQLRAQKIAAEGMASEARIAVSQRTDASVAVYSEQLIHQVVPGYMKLIEEILAIPSTTEATPGEKPTLMEVLTDIGPETPSAKLDAKDVKPSAEAGQDDKKNAKADGEKKKKTRPAIVTKTLCLNDATEGLCKFLESMKSLGMVLVPKQGPAAPPPGADGPLPGLVPSSLTQINIALGKRPDAPAPGANARNVTPPRA